MKIQEIGLKLVSAQGQWLSLSVVFAFWVMFYTRVGRDAARSQCCLERVPWDMPHTAHTVQIMLHLHQGRPSHL